MQSFLLGGLLFSCKMHVLRIHHWRQLPLLSSTPWFTFLVPFVFSVAFYFNHEEEEIFMPALRIISLHMNWRLNSAQK